MSRGRALVVATSVALAAACGGGASGGSASDGHQRVTVFAASSLTDSFTAIGKAYESAHPNATVTFSFAASSDLVQQVQQGAPADVIATASTRTMDEVSKNLTQPAKTFARNRLVIVTARGNPKHISSLADLGKKSLIVVLAAVGVPAGDYARQALSDAHVTVQPKSLEDNVRGVLTKVELGEADAGVVYVTDALVAGSKVTSVPVTNAPIATYPIGAIDSSGSAFVDFVLSDQGQRILARYGFLSP
ncbi:MAG TPA: molybdate ABC transporter substrate-binding protein [Mycobacteriales bacterium]|jgi:molybdate transport system substrate-binding protein|nr:molybdate ABC transporter substrate-binding protein [Mycobacteriales bacterium]